MPAVAEAKEPEDPAPASFAAGTQEEAGPSSGSPLHPSVPAEVEGSPSVEADVKNSQKDGQPWSQKQPDRKRKGSLAAKRNLKREHKMGNLNDAASEP